MTAQPIINIRYELIDKLGAGGMGAVYLTRDRLNNEMIALKRVLIQPEQLNFNSRAAAGSDTLELRLAITREFQLLAGLRHPHIISVRDYGFDDEDQPFFTMTLLENATDIREAARNDLGRVRLLIQMLQALSYLHRRGLLHRDLKPGNVLVDAYGGVKVLDFGLAVEREHVENSAGTLKYMAPEVLHGENASEATDLFAVGIIAYEMFTGTYPFNAPSPSQILMRIITETPDLSILPDDLDSTASKPGSQSGFLPDTPTLILHQQPPSDQTTTEINTVNRPPTTATPSTNADTAPRLADIIGKLLQKDLADRYQSADAVIRDLSALVGQQIPEESAETRESYLQAARFTGRDSELGQLTGALDNVLGSIEATKAWLIGGESGVGKSRLLDELRTRALINGVTVVRGQGVEGGGLPYQPWRDPLRRLVLGLDLSDLEAGVLKAIVPDIDKLLSRDVPDAPDLPGAAGRERLALTIADVFKHQAGPVLLLLEDLHWTRESLDPLKTLLRFVDDLQLMIVGTYRSDETPDLPESLPGMQVMPLQRLDSASIAALSASMLGEVGPDLLTLIERETEGNIFFMVETLRALAEDAGRLGDIGKSALPQTVMAGGVQQVVQRRLNRVPDWAQAALKLAAIAGRQIDEDVLLNALTNTMTITLVDHTTDEFLTACANVAVFDGVDGRWRFAHDKLREALMRDIDTVQKPSLHRAVAESIEAVYPDDDAYNEVLMNHWREAGDVDKEVAYLVPVAQRDVEITNNYARAHNLIERGLQILPVNDAQRVPLLNLLTGAYWGQGQLDSMEPVALQAQQLAKQTGDKNGLGTSYNNLGLMMGSRGQFQEAETYYQQALTIRRENADKVGIAASLNNLGAMRQQQGDFAYADKYYQESLQILRDRGHQRGIGLCLHSLGTAAAQQGNYAKAINYLRESMTIQEKIGNKRGVADCLIALGGIAHYQNDTEEAEDCLQKALAIQQQIGDQSGYAIAIHSLGVIAMGYDDITRAEAYFQQSLEIQRQLGDLWGAAYNLYYLGDVAYNLQDYDGAERYYTESLAIRREINDQMGIASSLNKLGILYLKIKDQQATQTLYDALSIASTIGIMPLTSQALAGIVGVKYQSGDYVFAAQLMGLVRNQPTPELQAQIKELLPKLQAALTPDELEAAMQRGAELDLDTVVAELLAEFGGDDTED